MSKLLSNKNGKRILRLNSLASLSILFVLLIFVISMMLYKNIIDETKEIRVKNSEELIQKDAEYIVSVKDYIDANLYGKLKDISMSIEESILSDTDLSLLEEQLNKNIIPDELNDILAEHTKDVNLLGLSGNYTHILVCNYNGVISDYSLSRATCDGKDRSWDHEIESQYNQELAKNTITNILDQDSNSMLVFETEKNSNENHKYFSEMSRDDLINVYIKEGLEGIKNYYFTVPVYITEDGDIFGKVDIINGTKQKTNKLIIIQEYSLYDYIIENNIDEMLYKVDTSTNSHEVILYLYAFIMIIFVIVVVLLLCCMSNALYDRDNGQISTIKLNNVDQTCFGRRTYDISPEQVKEMVAKLKEEENITKNK